MLSSVELKRLSESKPGDPVMRILMHLTAQASETANATARNLERLEGNVKSLRDEFNKKLTKVQADVTTKVAAIENDLTQLKESVDSSLEDQGKNISLLLEWKKGLNQCRASDSTILNENRSAMRKAVSVHRIELRMRKHRDEAALLRSRVILGSKGVNEVGGLKIRTALDEIKIKEVLETYVKGAVKTVSKLRGDGSLFLIAFGDHPDGYSGEKCAELFVSNWRAIGIALDAWVKVDRPRVLREGHRRATQFARWYKARFSPSDQPYFRFHDDHLVMDEFLVCPEMLIPEHCHWEKLAGLLDCKLGVDYTVFDEKIPYRGQYSPKVFDFLSGCLSGLASRE